MLSSRKESKSGELSRAKQLFLGCSRLNNHLCFSVRKFVYITAMKYQVARHGQGLQSKCRTPNTAVKQISLQPAKTVHVQQAIQPRPQNSCSLVCFVHSQPDDSKVVMLSICLKSFVVSIMSEVNMRQMRRFGSCLKQANSRIQKIMPNLDNETEEVLVVQTYPGSTMRLIRSKILGTSNTKRLANPECYMLTSEIAVKVISTFY